MKSQTNDDEDKDIDESGNTTNQNDVGSNSTEGSSSASSTTEEEETVKFDENHPLYPTVDIKKVAMFHCACSNLLLNNEMEILTCLITTIRKMQEKVQAIRLEKDSMHNKITRSIPNMLNFFVVLLEHNVIHSPIALQEALPLLCKTISLLPVPYHVLLAHYYKHYTAKDLLTLLEHLKQLICFQVTY